MVVDIPINCCVRLLHLVPILLNTHVQLFVLIVVLQLQLRSILRNQTGIEDWIVEKAHHRRNPGDPKFVYPYNLGWKNNLKQVR